MPSPLAARARRLSPLILVLIGACSMAPLQVDTAAKAPVIDGFGASTLAPSQGNAAARALFAQGMAQVYAFNAAEAQRAFKAALEQDPDCAMCAWGVAYQMGPNINNTDRGDLKDAVRYAAYAKQHSAGASARPGMRRKWRRRSPCARAAAAEKGPIPSTSPTPSACATCRAALPTIRTCWPSMPKRKWWPPATTGGTSTPASRVAASANWPTWSKRAWRATPSTWA